MDRNWRSWFRRNGNPRAGGRPRATHRLSDQAFEKIAGRVQELEEANRKLESINRIQQVEIDELTAVVARNLERVKAETRVLAGSAFERGPLSRILSAEQELENHD